MPIKSVGLRQCESRGALREVCIRTILLGATLLAAWSCNKQHFELSAPRVAGQNDDRSSSLSQPRPADDDTTPTQRLGKRQGAELLSMVSLIARSETLDARRLALVGAFSFGHEANHVCLSSLDLEHHVFENCVALFYDWSALGPDRAFVESTLSSWTGKYVRVEGVYNADEIGLLGGLYSGILAGVTSVELRAEEEEVPEDS